MESNQPDRKPIEIKTASVKYERKLNLGDYESATFEVALWADLREDVDLHGAMTQLWDMARANVREQINALRAARSDSKVRLAAPAYLGLPSGNPAAPPAEQASPQVTSTMLDELDQLAKAPPAVEEQTHPSPDPDQPPPVDDGFMPELESDDAPPARKPGETWTQDVVEYKAGPKGETLVKWGDSWAPAKSPAKLGAKQREYIVSKFGHEKHLGAHLQKWFHKGTLAALTYEETVVLVMACKYDQLSPRWYRAKIDERAAKSKAEPKTEPVKTPEKVVDPSDLLHRLRTRYQLPEGSPALEQLQRLPDPFVLGYLYERKAWGPSNEEDLMSLLTLHIDLGVPLDDEAFGIAVEGVVPHHAKQKTEAPAAAPAKKTAAKKATTGKGK